MTQRRNFWAALAALGLLAAACGGPAPAGSGAAASQPAASVGGASAAPSEAASEGTGSTGETTAVQLQLQWVPQAQFAGYFAALNQGYYEEEGLDVEILDGGPEIAPQNVGSDPNGPEFTIAWVPKVLEVRGKGESDLVDIAQIFQRSGTRSVAFVEAGIDSPEDFADKKVGVWDFGNDYEVIAAAKKAGLEVGTDFERLIQPFDMSLLLNGEIDVAEAMIYNEYAQVLETENPDTSELYQPEELSVIDYNEVGTAMLQDAIFAREAWLAEEGNEDVATRFLRASFRGWAYCRDNPDDCIQYVVDAGSTLGAGHQAWMMNEINPLIWPSPDGIGQVDEDLWQQTVDIAVEAKIIPGEPDEGAYRNDLAEAAREGVEEDLVGEGFTKGEVQVTPGGE